jgi:hypothetical protein
MLKFRILIELGKCNGVPYSHTYCPHPIMTGITDCNTDGQTFIAGTEKEKMLI